MVTLLPVFVARKNIYPKLGIYAQWCLFCWGIGYIISYKINIVNIVNILNIVIAAPIYPTSNYSTGLVVAAQNCLWQH